MMSECDSDRSSLPVDIVARPRKHDRQIRIEAIETHTHYYITKRYNGSAQYCDNGNNVKSK